MVQVLGGGLIFLGLTTVGLVIWLSRSRERAITAELETEALLKGRKARVEADKIIAESVDDESSWLDARRRDELQNSDSKPTTVPSSEL